MPLNFTMKGADRIDNGALSTRAFNKLVEQAFIVMGEYWHTHMRKKHFKVSAYQEYGYARRSNKYTKAKAKKLNHIRPLEFSGVSKALSATANIYATKNSVRVTMPGVRAFNLRAKGQQYDMHDEFTRITPRELRELEQVAEKQLTKLVDAALKQR